MTARKLGTVAVSPTVLVTFTTVVTVTAATYLASKLIDKFAPDLRPKSITVDPVNKQLVISFHPPTTQLTSGAKNSSDFAVAVRKALTAAQVEQAAIAKLFEQTSVAYK